MNAERACRIALAGEFGHHQRGILGEVTGAPGAQRGHGDVARRRGRLAGERVVGHPFRQFLAATVELNDMTTDAQVFSPNHRFSIW